MCSTSFTLWLLHIANLLTEKSVRCTYCLGLVESVGEFGSVQKSHYPCWGLCLACFWSLPLLGITVGLLLSWICSMLFHGCTFHWAHLSWFPFHAYDEYILRITQFLHLQLLHNEVILYSDFSFGLAHGDGWCDIYVCLGWQIFSTGLRGFVVPVAAGFESRCSNMTAFWRNLTLPCCVCSGTRVPRVQ